MNKVWCQFCGDYFINFFGRWLPVDDGLKIKCCKNCYESNPNTDHIKSQ